MCSAWRVEAAEIALFVDNALTGGQFHSSVRTAILVAILFVLIVATFTVAAMVTCKSFGRLFLRSLVTVIVALLKPKRSLPKSQQKE